MSRTRGYKKAENNFVRRVGYAFKKAGLSVSGFFTAILNAGRKKLTIMVVPHSQKRVVNFQTSFFSIIFSFILVIGAACAFFYFAAESAAASRKLSTLKAETIKAQASLDSLRDETNNLLKNAKNFQTTLSSTLTSLGLRSVMEVDKTEEQTGDLINLFNIREAGEASLKEIEDLRHLSEYLQNSLRPVQEMGKLLDSQTALFSDIPSLWPIKGGIGHISMAFGQNRHPITGQWYIHTGIDLSTYRQGDPIIATADGQVVTVEYDPGWGNYVIVKHKHGFYTRYAHLQSYRVARGEHVQQGQVIGYIGNTGISTGPHIHYEVHIGSDVVDPIKYLNIRTSGRK